MLTSSSPSWGVRGLRWGLRLASLPYGLVVGLRNLAYSRGWRPVFRSPLAVVSVGNLSVGGTGKSPLVAWLGRWFRARDIRVAILSRGYGQLDSGQNDEALELEMQLPDVPHLQHWDRVASAQLAEEELEMQLLLLDDGFQHRRMGRDLDIVLLDASDSPAALWLLPGGLLREPLRSLKRADVVILTRIDQITPSRHRYWLNLLHRWAPQAQRVEACHRPSHLLVAPEQRRPLSDLRGKRVLAFCAIGNPESFFGGLTQLGAELLDRKTWPDHHGYGAGDIGNLERWVEEFPTAEMLVCTMKDWVKIQAQQLAGIELAAVAIELQITAGQAELEVYLESVHGLLKNRLAASS